MPPTDGPTTQKMRRHDAAVDALAALRDSVAGVSVEEEMTRLSQFAHASEAAARVVGVVDELLQSLLRSL